MIKDRLTPDINRDLEVEYFSQEVRDLKDFIELVEQMWQSASDLVIATRTALGNADFFEDIAAVNYKIERSVLADTDFLSKLGPRQSSFSLSVMDELNIEDRNTLIPHVHKDVILSSESPIPTHAISYPAALEKVTPFLRERRVHIDQALKSIYAPEDESEKALIREAINHVLNTDGEIDKNCALGVLAYLKLVVNCRRLESEHLQALHEACKEVSHTFDWDKKEIALALIREDVIHFGGMKIDASYVRASQQKLKYLSPGDSWKKKIEEIRSIIALRKAGLIN